IISLQVGPRELTGAVDLISHYKLLPHHQFFCKRSLPLSISDSHYLHNVVGDSEVMKGEGMQLDQLIQDTPYSRETNVRIQPFDLPVLTKAFQLREFAPIDLSTVIFFAILRLTLDFSFHLVAEKGVPTIAGKPKSESKNKERKHKKHKDKDREKDKEHKKHKHRHKDKSKDKDKEKKKDKSGHQEPGAGHTKKHHEKKRKHDGDEDLNGIQSHKKSKIPYLNHLASVSPLATGPSPVASWTTLAASYVGRVFWSSRDPYLSRVIGASESASISSVSKLSTRTIDSGLTKDCLEGVFTCRKVFEHEAVIAENERFTTGIALI
ncbi:hypothetical protein C3L33_07216, partial [Rhododendron williamsianum]